MRPSPLDLYTQRFIADRFGLETAQAVFPHIEIFAETRTVTVYRQRPRRVPHQPRQSTPNR